MLQEVPVRALGAVEEVFLLALLALFGAGVGVRVGHLGGAPVGPDVYGVVPRDHGGQSGGCEDVAGVRGGRFQSRFVEMIRGGGR